MDEREDVAYQTFLAGKAHIAPSVGRTVSPDALPPDMFPFQRDLTVWALRKGRAALFLDTGLGKTLCQLAWAQHAADRALILAPLAVAQQTVREGRKFGITATYARRQADAPVRGITVTNYEMLDHFDAAEFGAVVLDESSILKAYEGKTRTQIIQSFRDTPLRLACTATPAPNDIAEIANHAEFLGVMSRTEMLAAFFVHDDDGWRLKGHARAAFYRWLASWGMAIRYPSNLGYSDDGYLLPPLRIRPVIIESDYVPEGQLFATGLKGITDRSRVRRGTLALRVDEAVRLVAAEPSEPWILWCGLNAESDALAAALPDAVNVEGSQSAEEKAARIERFLAGDARVLITKAGIAGFGLNFQHCARMAFVGLSDSWEQYYQCVRRCWRFGQARPVDAYVLLSDAEEPIWANVQRKEVEADRMQEQLVRHVAEFERTEIAASARQTNTYETDEARGDGWRLLLGDSCERLRELPENSIDFSVFSPPFSTLYVYSNSDRDLGNVRDDGEFWQHFGWVSRELLRVMRPGRNIAVHCAQLVTTKAMTGVIGLRDFRGDTIRHFTERGFIYHGEVCIDKDPQVQAIRTKSKSLLFVQLRKDASWLRPALADYILLFRKPGENAVPVQPDISNEDWISWARPVWYGIKETETLNVAVARENDDERHICPLQLGVIERCIRLWTNPGETVLSPFAGIGSEIYQAVKLGRRGIGIELKRAYWEVAVCNVREAERLARTPDLFAWAEEHSAG